MTDQKSELMDRVKAKKKEIEADIARAKAGAKGSKNESVEKLETKLDEIQALLKQAKNDTTEAISKKLNEWLQ